MKQWIFQKLLHISEAAGSILSISTSLKLGRSSHFSGFYIKASIDGKNGDKCVAPIRLKWGTYCRRRIKYNSYC